MRTTESIDQGELVAETRQLRKAVESLVDELEGGQHDLEHVRDALPASPAEKQPIGPPWEREGMEKDEWLESKRGGPNNE